MSSTRYRVPESLSSGVALAGKPIANSQVYILDAHLRQCPVGVPGEITSAAWEWPAAIPPESDGTLKYSPDPFT